MRGRKLQKTRNFVRYTWISRVFKRTNWQSWTANKNHESKSWI